MIGIYKIITGGKVYIGASENIEESWERHKRNSKNSNSAFYQSLRRDLKHGKPQFIVITDCSIKDLPDLEEYYILQNDSYFNGWNRTLGSKYDNQSLTKRQWW